MRINCKMPVWMQRAMLAVCMVVAVPAAFGEQAVNRLEHLHHAGISVAHAVSTAQLLGHALAKRAIGQSENQFQRDLNHCENLSAVNFGEARWRLQAIDAATKVEELGYSEKLFIVLLEAARQWNGTTEDAYNVIEAIGVLSYQLERLSVSIGRMSDEELATLRQRPSTAAGPSGISTTAASAVTKSVVDTSSGRPPNTAIPLDDQNL
jgi:hypothetical protein